MRKVLIDRNNHLRAILTDTLPYEIPLFFTNEPLYFCATKNQGFQGLPEIVGRLLNEKRHTKPFSYKVQKGGGAHRKLAIPHPANQLRYAELYRDFDAFIENICSRSRFSLRYPSRVGSHFYKSQFANEQVGGALADPDPASFSTQRKWASSYFYYQRYSHIHKFFASAEFIRLEQQYPWMLKIDIARCFESIYTHSISWAVRGKEFSKENIQGFFFESEFDSRMQAANWGETNGILIGPEVSRIFAEAILQSVDVELDRKLGDIRTRVDVRRYVDDFFVFAHEESDLREVKSLIEDVCSQFNLHINEKKTEIIARPLISSFSVARQRVNAILKDLLKTARATLADESEQSTFSRFAADNAIAEVRRIAKEGSVDYPKLASPGLGVVARGLNQIRRRFEGAHGHAHKYGASVIYALLRVSTFLFLMDIRSSTAHKLAKIFLDASILFDKVGNGRLAFEGAVADCVRLSLEQAKTQKISGPEVINVLVAADAICRKTRGASEAQIKSALGIDNDWKEGCADLNYFELVATLYFARAQHSFNDARAAVSHEIERRVRSLGSKLSTHAEETMLFFDYLSCPYIDRQKRIQLFDEMSSACGHPIPPADLVGEFERVSKAVHFVAWEGATHFQALLERRELQSAYDS